MAIFGNNIKNPFSTDHPHDEKKEPMSHFKSLRSFMLPKKFAEGGVVPDPNGPAKPFGDVPVSAPPSEKLAQQGSIQNSPAPQPQAPAQGSVQQQVPNTLEPQRFAQGGVVPGASSLRMPVAPAAPAQPSAVAPQRAVAHPWQRNQSAGGSRSQISQKPAGVQPRRFAEGGMVEGDEEYNQSIDSSRHNKIKEQIDNMILQKQVDQELQGKFPIQDKPPQQFALGGMVQPGQPGGVDPNARKQKTGTGFVNLQKMMGASSGQKLGQTVAGGITGGAEQVKSQLGQEKEQYGQKLGEASSVFDASKRDAAIKSANESGTVNDEQSKAFEGYRAGKLGAQELSGGLQGYGDLSSKASDVVQQGKDVGSQAGRYNLLQRYASGGKQYGAGAKRLDAMLMGQGGGAQALQQARMSTSGVGSQLQQAQEGAQAQYGVAAGKAKQFGEETEAQLGGATSAVDKEVDFPAKQKALQEKYAQIQSLKDQRPDDAYESTHQGSQAAYDKAQQSGAEQLGIAGDYTYGMAGSQLADYASLDPNQMQNASQFASKEQNARMNALMKLSGKDAGQSNWGTAQGGEAEGALKVGKGALAAKLADLKGKESESFAKQTSDLASTENWGNQVRAMYDQGDAQAKAAFMADTENNPVPQQMIGGDEFNPPQVNPQYEAQMADYNARANAAGANLTAGNAWKDTRAGFNASMEDRRRSIAEAKAAALAAYRGNTFGSKGSVGKQDASVALAPVAPGSKLGPASDPNDPKYYSKGG